MNAVTFSRQERQTLCSLSALFSCRMLGLFMLVPVMALYAPHLDGYQPELLGLILGGYGLSQALLQIPFGLWSDRLGRKPVIRAGIALFALGSLVAACSDTAWGVIVGRLLQGAGAVSGATLALAADLTREQLRSKMMALIGISIGLSFALAFVLGPIVAHALGLSGVFWISLGLSALAWWLLERVPTPALTVATGQSLWRQLAGVVTHGQLLRLDLGIFSLHLILTASFVVIPVWLRDAGLAGAQQAWLYLPVLLLSFLLMGLLMGIAARRAVHKAVFMLALVLLVLSLSLLWLWSNSWLGLAAALVVFFTAFNVLEGSLPSFISRVAPADSKGAALGVYSTVQFIGVAVGGSLGSWLATHLGSTALLLVLMVLVLVWIGSSYGLVLPELKARSQQDLPEPLAELHGVADVALDDDHHA